jgi:hypothetical protein
VTAGNWPLSPGQHRVCQVIVTSVRPAGSRSAGPPALFGQDGTGLFVGPGLRPHTPLHDTYHPNGLVIDGSTRGAWGRRAGRVTVKVFGPLSAAIRSAIRDEAESMPIPGTAVTLSLDEH